MKVPILVSACLLGEQCTYDGSDERRDDLVAALAASGADVVAVCPERMGGLGVPRPRCEVDGGDGDAVLDGRGEVRDAAGGVHTAAYVAGARAVVATAQHREASLAILKDRSPACGCAGIPDGSHSKTLNSRGRGVAAAALLRAGVEVVTEDVGVAFLAGPAN